MFDIKEESFLGCVQLESWENLTLPGEQNYTKLNQICGDIPPSEFSILLSLISLFSYLVTVVVLFGITYYIDLWTSICIFVENGRTITVEVSDTRPNGSYSESLYPSLLRWCSKNLKDFHLQHSQASDSCVMDERGKRTDVILSYPGFNSSVKFHYKGASIQLERLSTPEIQEEGSPCEKITLSSSLKNREKIYNLLKELQPRKSAEQERRTTIYGAEDGSWSQIGHPKRRRPLSSIILAEELKSKIINDIKEFRASEDWYITRGIPYRRGYLLYGPPGTGKSSLIKSIAGEFEYDICILSLTTRGLNDDVLNVLTNSTPYNCIILLEDVDAAFRSREDPFAQNREQKLAFAGGTCCSSVTFGGLLNALDGVASTEGRIIFMTTNYIERLDPAMLRTGRVDFRIEVGYPKDKQLVQMFERFYPKEENEETKTEFVEEIRNLKTKKVSMAAVQGLFLMHKESGREAVENVREYFKEQRLLAPKSTEFSSSLMYL